MEPKALQIAAAGAAVAAVGAVVAYKHVVAPRNTDAGTSLPLAHYSIVCFLDSADGAIRGRVLRWPRGAPMSDLIAAVGALHDLDTPR